MRRILVIGARGMLGRDLVERLHSSYGTGFGAEWEILAWDLDEIDIQKEQETRTRIEDVHPEIVINLAAYTNVDGCETQVEKAYGINGEGMKYVALGAAKCRARVVYLSTDYVFDGRKKEPYLETDSPEPLNVYGHSKLMGERHLQALTEKGLIVRTQWLYGKYGNNFISAILRHARERGEVSIVNDQTGSPTYTRDLASALCLLIQRGAQGIFHVSNSGECTWYAFGQMVLDLCGLHSVKVKPISSQELGRPALRPSYSVLGCQKLRQEMGISLRPWSEAVKEYLGAVEG